MARIMKKRVSLSPSISPKVLIFNKHLSPKSKIKRRHGRGGRRYGGGGGAAPALARVPDQPRRRRRCRHRLASSVPVASDLAASSVPAASSDPAASSVLASVPAYVSASSDTALATRCPVCRKKIKGAQKKLEAHMANHSKIENEKDKECPKCHSRIRIQGYYDHVAFHARVKKVERLKKMRKQKKQKK